MNDKKPIQLGCVYYNPKNVFLNGRGCVYDINGIAPTILTMSGGAINHLLLRKSKKIKSTKICQESVKKISN